MNVGTKHAMSLVATLAVSACLWAAPASAIILAPNQSGTATGGDPFNGLTPVDTTGVLNWSTGGGVSGTLIQNVYQDPSLPGVSFEYIVTVNGGSPEPVSRVTSTNFTGWITDVDFVSGANSNGGTTPTNVLRTVSGQTVAFNFINTTTFQGTLQPGTFSRQLYVLTNAPGYKLGGFTGIINGGATQVQTFMPSPEPGSLILLGSGLAGLGYVGRRRRRRSA